MSPEEVKRQQEEGLARLREQLQKQVATPILSIGVGHKGGADSGRIVLSWAKEMPLEDLYRMLDAMRDDVAARLGIS